MNTLGEMGWACPVEQNDDERMDLASGFSSESLFDSCLHSATDGMGLTEWGFRRCVQAKLAYLCSQMCCTDEVKMHARCVSLSWVEFLEAIARVAEFMQPPTAEEEAVWMQESVDTDWDEMNQVCVWGWEREGPPEGCVAGFFIAAYRSGAAL